MRQCTVFFFVAMVVLAQALFATGTKEIYQGNAQLKFSKSTTSPAPIDPNVSMVNITLKAAVVHRTGNITSQDIGLILSMKLQSQSFVYVMGNSPTRVTSEQTSVYNFDLRKGAFGKVFIPIDNVPIFSDVVLSGVGVGQQYLTTDLILSLDLDKSKSGTDFDNIFLSLTNLSAQLNFPTPIDSLVKSVGVAFGNVVKSTTANNTDKAVTFSNAGFHFPAKYPTDPNQYPQFQSAGTYMIIFGPYVGDNAVPIANQLTEEQIQKQVFTFDESTKAVKDSSGREVQNDYLVISLTSEPKPSFVASSFTTPSERQAVVNLLQEHSFLTEARKLQVAISPDILAKFGALTEKSSDQAINLALSNYLTASLEAKAALSAKRRQLNLSVQGQP